jgi:hypothetical protein
MTTTPATDTLSLVIEAIAYAWDAPRSRDNLTWAAESGNLEVAWILAEENDGYGSFDLQVSFFSEAVDAAAPPCWDGCNGITTQHRAGWCLTTPEHADLDCGCGEADYDYEDELDAPVTTITYVDRPVLGDGYVWEVVVAGQRESGICHSYEDAERVAARAVEALNAPSPFTVVGAIVVDVDEPF